MVLGGALGPGLGGRDAGGAASLLRGRRGTILHPRSFCVAGVAQTRMYRRFVPSFCTVVLRGRRGTYGTGWRPWARCRAWRRWRRFTSAWQAWHNLTSMVVLRGRRGTDSHVPSFCTVVLRGRHGTYGTGWRPWARFRRAWRQWRRFTSAWQAWHNLTSTVVLRGRRGTDSHVPSFCVAGVALMVLGGALGPGLGGRDALGAASLLRGRLHFCVAGVAQSYIILHPRSFCVAGVAQTGMYRRFAWQAWHYGTGWRPWARFRRAWRPWRRFTSAWQAWHNLTSTVVLRRRRGTDSHVPSFCVAGVALMVLGGALGPGLDFHHVVLVVLFWSLWPN